MNNSSLVFGDEPTLQPETTTAFSYELPFGQIGIIVASVTIIPMAFMGIFGNGLTIFVLLKGTKLKSIFNMFIASLCFSDFLSALISPLFLYRRTWGFLKWELSAFLCSTFWAVDSGTSVVTALHILSFAGLRFISLISPHSYNRIKEKHAKIFIIGIWVTSISFGFIPFAIWFSVVDIDRSVQSVMSTWPSCTLQKDWIPQFRLYAVVGYPIFFYVPIVLIALLSVSIGICLLRRRNSRKNSSNAQSQGMDEAEAKRQTKENQAIYQLSLIVGSFMLGYIPHTAYHLFTINNSAVTKQDHQIHWWFGTLEYICLRFSECLNPVFYNMASTKMRNETLNCLRKLFGIKQKMNGDVSTSAAVTKSTAVTRH